MEIAHCCRFATNILHVSLCSGCSHVRFHPGPHRSLEVEQPGGRTDKTGQFVLAIDRSQHTPDELFEQAQMAEENGDVAGAERLYRILMKSDQTDASAPFNPWKLVSDRCSQC